MENGFTSSSEIPGDPRIHNAPLGVVVVDDDPSILRLVKFELERNGYRVYSAATGQQAREVIARERWDLAILDRWLPDADGLQICQAIKSDPRFINSWVILLSAHAEAREKVEGLDRGADDYVSKPFHIEELLARVRTGARLVELRSQLIEANRVLERLSITDSLTGTFNRRHFYEVLQRMFELAQRHERPLAIAMIDIDHFKSVNDTYGHAGGDQALQAIASLLRQSIRASDLLARYGGEEFVILLPELTLEQAEEFGEKLRKTSEAAEFPVAGTTTHICLSVGVASLSRSEVSSAKELVDAADAALYRAKEKGRNRVEVERRRFLRAKKPMR